MIKHLFISRFFFVLLAGVVLLFILSYAWSFLFLVAQVGVLSLIALSLLDFLVLFANKSILKFQRIFPRRGDLNDEAHVSLRVVNLSAQVLKLTIYEGFPEELQERSKAFSSSLLPKRSESFNYSFTPKRRGDYRFENTHIFVQSVLRLVKRRVVVVQDDVMEVYPSIQQMKLYELKVFNQSQVRGIKKIRSLGHNNEFEQIKSYTQGDDIRTINWKATSRRNELMVNQYQDQRAQHVYSVIDKSRSMEMAFDGMSLLDYAINSSLVFSNIALRKGDKKGVITYADKIGTKLAAEGGRAHLKRIMEVLYNQRTQFKEANFPLLYQSLRSSVKVRSLLMLYTNFETEQAMHRALPLLRKLNAKHLLVVVFFENTQLRESIVKPPENMRDIYVGAVAETTVNVKRKIALELNRNGIQTILTKPEELNVKTINKYLSLKSKGMI
ncbi:DUF58 domain-containing protein [Lishizhenia sp.]|uniref:DUF58 domain-containing protein n=1 Tax=Lishizhenia sp. TaxID=2497594 RepID=UPI00299D497C|nr:DUF58 domain-containing protein [Lishizhenia sp.]MDX1445818.1 DUF58 domain-containing protein [Lishizhenia sp.]